MEIHFLQYDMNAPIGFNVHVDYIIHAAGNAHPAAFNGNPVGTTMGNIESTFRLLEYLANQSPIPKQVLNSAKIEKLGWKPTFDVEEGICHTLNILRGL